ncbi:MAG: hypothetical protein U0V75_16340 [Ferruginibacter sp.]
MKKLLFMLLISTIAMSSTCSKSTDDTPVSSSVSIPASQVPAAVMTTFNSKYPTASGQIEWEKEDGNTYKVKFFIGSQRKQATFTAAGAFIAEKDI